MSEPASTNATRVPAWARTVIFVLAAAGLAAAISGPLLWNNARDLCDDALISARFAKNWADGNGLRYNLAPPGERPVEGYSNFLWVAGLAAGFKFQLPARVITGVMGGASALLSMIVLGWWVRDRTKSAILGLAAAAMLAANIPYALWAVQGLETPMFALFALAAIAAADPDRPRPAEYIFALLAGLTRPDGLIVVLCIALVQALSAKRDLRRFALTAGLCFALPYSIYLAWKLVHFGAVIPNTYFAKTGLGAAGVTAGLRYLFSAQRLQTFPGVVFAAGLIARRFTRGPFRPLAPGIIFILAYGAFILLAGGDFMPNHRFVMHLLPVMIGLGAIGLARLIPRERPASKWQRLYRPVWGPAAFIVILTVGMYNRQSFILSVPHKFNPVPATLDWHHNQATWYGRAAGWLARHAKPDDVIAAGDIGYLGWVSGVDRILDTNGLVDPYLARLPGAANFQTDPGYVIGQHPDFIVLMVHYYDDGRALGHSAFDRAVLADPGRFLAGYVLAAELPAWRTLKDGLIRFRIYRRAPGPVPGPG